MLNIKVTHIPAALPPHHAIDPSALENQGLYSSLHVNLTALLGASASIGDDIPRSVAGKKKKQHRVNFTYF